MMSKVVLHSSQLFHQDTASSSWQIVALRNGPMIGRNSTLWGESWPCHFPHFQKIKRIKKKLSLNWNLCHFRLFKTRFFPHFFRMVFISRKTLLVSLIYWYYLLQFRLNCCIICSTNRDSIRQRFEQIMQTNPHFHYFFPFSKGNRVFDRWEMWKESNTFNTYFSYPGILIDFLQLRVQPIWRDW